MDYDFDCGNKIAALLGTLWTKSIASRDICKTVIAANVEAQKQTEQDHKELVACLSRHTVPLYHVERWLPIKFRQSDLKNGSYPLPDDIVHIPLLCNRIAAPSLVFCNGLDFKLSPGAITFNSGLFENPLCPRSADAEICLWGCYVRQDWHYLHDHFGHMLGIEQPTSTEYKHRINTLLDVLNTGTTMAGLRAILALELGVPTALEDGETVEGLYSDRRGRFLATSRNIYRIADNAAVSVLGGQALYRGQPLTNEFTVWAVRPGANLDGIRELTLPTGMLEASIGGELTFRNEEMPVVEVAGRKVLPILGPEVAVNRFWEIVYKRNPQLDLGLGDTANPLRFLVDRVLCNNCVVVVSRLAESASQLLRRVVPPGISVLFTSVLS